MLCHGLHHGETKADIRYKNAVHHIKMVPVTFTGVEHFNIALQVTKIGTQQRGGNHSHRGVMYLGVFSIIFFST